MPDQQPSATAVALTLVDELAAQGVTDVVVSPGSRSAPLSLAVAAHEGLRMHVRVDERSAAFLALGLARGAGRPTALVCSSGTATANYHPAVMEADAAGVGVIVLTADRPPELRDIGANQTATQQHLYGGAVRWFHEVSAGGDRPGAYLRSVVARAMALAAGGVAPAGPVHLNVPLREPLLDDTATALPGHPGGSTVAASPSARSGPASRMGDAGPDRAGPRPAGSAGTGAATWLPAPVEVLAGRRGLVIAGEGAVGGDDVLDVAAALGWPVLAEPTSGLRHRDPAIRTGHWLAASEAFVGGHRPEVVVQLGRPVLSRPVGAIVAGCEQVVVCDPLDRGWDPQRNARLVLPVAFAEWAAPAVDGAERVEGWLDAWRDADDRAGAVLDRLLDEGTDPTELGLVRDLARALPDDSVLTVASSLAIRHLNETMPVRNGLRVVGNRGVSGIDGFVSTAVGVALAHDGPAVALAGDLSMVHDMTGLVIGPDEPVPALPIVVINNDGGGIFDLLPYGSGVAPATFRRLFATPHGVPLGGLAITTGAGYLGLDEMADLPGALDDAWANPGITIVEVTTDTPTETARYHRIREAIAAELG
ncbi:2-succinyl-5-enolpyruvyl-6-hydroxy-3-cyclohexene-1-carboxylic-acid synthase [Euzebya rosea]|uniref:2-succinyl-5-enolpyruvyl-6-hydroxy-3- cyclohexene-1-carboxylic-acid synthase n=1 Tax=Euzebya rosea TaxID=2052804 RepID=UPI001300739D|nr:2-succinyl-5-enolpyruvyl-6-hydroxy-3-cyclohexene-1-carboxylic-acid synthase [Euzebya rosea]